MLNKTMPRCRDYTASRSPMSFWKR